MCIRDSSWRESAALWNAGRTVADVTAEVAQGSVLGMDLCNISCDCLLRMEMLEELCLMGYSNYVVVLVAAYTIDQSQIKLNRVRRSVNNWMVSHGLTLALSKTEVVVLTKERIPTVIPVQVGDKVVEQ